MQLLDFTYFQCCACALHGIGYFPYITYKDLNHYEWYLEDDLVYMPL